MIDWSPSSPAVPIEPVVLCHHFISDALPTLLFRRGREPGRRKTFPQFFGVPAERISTLFQRIAHNPLAPTTLRGSTLYCVASFIMAGFHADVRSCFVHPNRQDFWPEVAWARDFAQQEYVGMLPDDVITRILLCWIALFDFDGVGVENMAVKAVKGDIIDCLAKWSLGAGHREASAKCVLSLSPSSFLYLLNCMICTNPVENCMEVVMLMWKHHKLTPKASDYLRSEVALALLYVKHTPCQGSRAAAVEAWSLTYAAILRELGNHPPTCGHCGTNGAAMKRCSRCKAAQYCSQACQKKYVRPSHSTLRL